MTKEREVAEELMLEIKSFIPNTQDCYTIICEFYKRCYQIDLPRYSYDIDAKNVVLPDKVYLHWQTFMDKDELLPGDLVIFNIPIGTGVHTAVYIGDGDYLNSIKREEGGAPVMIMKLRDIGKSFKCFARYRDR